MAGEKGEAGGTARGKSGRNEDERNIPIAVAAVSSLEVGSFTTSWHVESRSFVRLSAGWRVRAQTAQPWTFTFQPLRGRLFSSAPVNGAPPLTPASPPPPPLCEYGIDRIACTRGIIHLPAAEDLAPTRLPFLRPYRYISLVIRTIDCDGAPWVPKPFRSCPKGMYVPRQPSLTAARCQTKINLNGGAGDSRPLGIFRRGGEFLLSRGAGKGDVESERNECILK